MAWERVAIARYPSRASFFAMQQRDDLRAQLYADPAWIAFGPKTTGYIQTMETAILRPTSWSPIK